MYTRRRVMKRLFDLAASLSLLAAFLPIILLIALAIWLSEPRHSPVFFQLRYTRGLKPFHIVKLRTMSKGKVTRLGSAIRRRGLDELPQLFNIALGQMSFVGPRAHSVEEADFLLLVSARYRHRFQTKAGVTGLCQLRGLNIELFDERRLNLLSEIDRHYVRTQSTRKDIKL